MFIDLLRAYNNDIIFNIYYKKVRTLVMDFLWEEDTMVTKYGRNLGLSKVELFAIWAVLVVALLLATANIYWIADQFGIHLATGTARKLLDAMASGASLGTAFAAILGVTLPAWALAAAGALGATAA